MMSRIIDYLHEQYESDGSPVLFSCTECAYYSMSLGSLHAHVEGHRGYTRFNIQIPFTSTSQGDFDQLMKYTKVIKADSVTEIGLSEVDGL